MKYVVDFASELSEIVTETKYMEQLGFSIPELARNVALQVSMFYQYDMFLAYVTWSRKSKSKVGIFKVLIAPVQMEYDNVPSQYLDKLFKSN